MRPCNLAVLGSALRSAPSGRTGHANYLGVQAAQGDQLSSDSLQLMQSCSAACTRLQAQSAIVCQTALGSSSIASHAIGKHSVRLSMRSPCQHLAQPTGFNDGNEAGLAQSPRSYSHSGMLTFRPAAVAAAPAAVARRALKAMLQVQWHGYAAQLNGISYLADASYCDIDLPFSLSD